MISSVYFKKIAEGIASFYSIIGKYLSSRIDLTMHIINYMYMPILLMIISVIHSDGFRLVTSTVIFLFM